MDIVLDEAQVRVLGCLVEKQLATPAYYPLSLNSLVSACNQRSNRAPVVNYTGAEVEDALRVLMDKGLASRIKGSDSRVYKYGHLVRDALSLLPVESAVLAELMLRGAQTQGELKTRASRMVSIGSLDEVEKVLTSLMDQGYVRRLSRMPGQKERRFTLLFVSTGDSHPDTGVNDTSVHDTGVRDTGVNDTSDADISFAGTGVHDTGVHDTGVRDTGVNDTSDADMSFAGTGVHDTGVHDTGVIDTEALLVQRVEVLERELERLKAEVRELRSRH